MPPFGPQPVIIPGQAWVWFFGKRTPIPLTKDQVDEFNTWLSSIGLGGASWIVDPEAHTINVQAEGKGLLDYISLFDKAVYDALSTAGKKFWNNLKADAKNLLRNIEDPVKVAAIIALLVAGDYAGAIAVALSASATGTIDANTAKGLSDLTGGSMSASDVQDMALLLNDPAAYVNKIVGPTLIAGQQALDKNISQSVDNATSAIQDTQAAATDSLNQYLQNALATTSSYEQGLFGSIRQDIQTVLGFVGNFADSILSEVSTPILQAVKSVGDLVSTLQSYFETAIGGIQNTLDTLGSGILDALDTGVKDIADFAVSVTNTIDAHINGILSGVQGITNDLEQGFRSFISSTVGAVTATATDIEQAIGGIPAAIDKLSGMLKDAVAQGGIEVIDNLVSRITEAVAARPAKGTASGSSVPDRLYAAIDDVLKPPPDELTFIKQVYDGLGGMGPVFGSLMTVLISLYIFVPSVQGIAQYQAQESIQYFRMQSPHTLLPIADIITMFQKGILSREAATLGIRQYGYNQSTVDALIEAAQFVTPPGDIASWYLRGLISEKQIDARLAAQGWRSEDIASYKQAIYFIPGPQDLVTMAVREAFTPDIAQTYGQFQNFPEQFATYAAMQGVSRDWALRYWAAHWQLPSATMGFGMFHRGIIDKAELDVLLRALDIMPYWRDRLTSLAYDPVTRIDIRRMYHIGVIDIANVEERYKILGYSPEDAKLLAQFVEKEYAAPDATTAQEVRDLSKTDILTYYSDGTIKADQALTLLEHLGYSPDTAQTYIDHTQFVKDQAERKNQTDLILAEAKAGIITYDDAQTKLNQLGLSTQETDAALTKLVQQRTSQTSLPTRAELDKMLAHRIIDTATYVDTMERRGYTAEWTQRFLKLAQVG